MSKDQPPTPARLYVIQASEAPKAVIFRRGPSDWVRLILWHTNSDVIEPGQWFKGRIYADTSDLSPDGSLLFYHASKYDARHLEDVAYTHD